MLCKILCSFLHMPWLRVPASSHLQKQPLKQFAG
jgi:hypothetical protein